MRNEEEFVKIIKDNQGTIFRISSFYAVDSEDRKDLYQEIVYQLWKSYGSFQGASSVSTWLYRVALNTSLTHSKRRRRQETIPIEAFIQLKDDMDHHGQERVAMMYRLIETLNKIDKGLILLYLEGKNYEEMAQITGLTTTNVGTRLHRIKSKLKTKMKQC